MSYNIEAHIVGGKTVETFLKTLPARADELLRGIVEDSLDAQVARLAEATHLGKPGDRKPGDNHPHTRDSYRREMISQRAGRIVVDAPQFVFQLTTIAPRKASTRLSADKYPMHFFSGGDEVYSYQNAKGTEANTDLVAVLGDFSSQVEGITRRRTSRLLDDLGRG